MRHVIFYSGGIASYITAKRVIARQGAANCTLLFTDTNYEHEDLYRFLDESCKHLGVELTRIADGRTPWEVFRDVRFLGNTRADPCSKILKRDLAQKWVRDNHDPADTTLYLGLTADEKHRLVRSKRFWEPYTVESPLMDEPTTTKADMISECRRDRIEPPELYSLGFPHNNCGGFCVKAGQAHFLHLLRELPDKYAEVEQKEQEMRDLLGDVAILRDRRGGETKPLTLKQLRTRSKDECNFLDWGGCGCFGDAEEQEGEIK